jgi:putative transposase
VLCLDRGFYSIDVSNFLEEHSIPYVIPVVKHGKSAEITIGGPKILFPALHGPEQKQIQRRTPGSEGRIFERENGKERQGFFRIRCIRTLWTPEKEAPAYKSRVGIESSYRIRNNFRPLTTSRNPTLRFLFAIIEFLMEYIWVSLQWIFFTPLRRGPRGKHKKMS